MADPGDAVALMAATLPPHMPNVWGGPTYTQRLSGTHPVGHVFGWSGMDGGPTNEVHRVHGTFESRRYALAFCTVGKDKAPWTGAQKCDPPRVRSLVMELRGAGDDKVHLATSDAFLASRPHGNGTSSLALAWAEPNILVGRIRGGHPILEAPQVVPRGSAASMFQALYCDRVAKKHAKGESGAAGSV